MATVELSASALQALDELIETRDLPADARQRVRRRLQVLEAFPRLAAPLAGRWEGYRGLLGPWPWMRFVYEVLEDGTRVVIVAVLDTRTASASA